MLPALCSHREQLITTGAEQPGLTEARAQVQLMLSSGNGVEAANTANVQVERFSQMASQQVKK